ncbi:NPP1-domain-containing protein [Xylariaceae sp. FL0804]|nr:NPP1-domain-containing protein [Xylariaceae sp. FL0804]
MRARQALALSVAAALGASAAPLESSIDARDVIDHDAVVGFAEAGSATTLQYKPFLKVVNGCVPFPAVDAEGNTSGGLNPSGAAEGDCSSSLGQVYARATQYSNETYAIMYSWYMPKDEPSTGIGHRHDWECSVVWLSSNSTTATIQALSTSAHGDLDTITSGISLDGTRPFVKYQSYWPIDHALFPTDVEGGEQPLIEWEYMTEAARDALTNTDWGSANVPFLDSSFMSNLDDGAPSL